jgi:1,4-dihydroxy-2-naphthoate octaprenyltransferase
VWRFVTMRIRIWLQALRLPFLSASIIPLLLGTIIAWSEHGVFDVVAMVWALAAVAFIHLGANLSNDYFDYRSGNDLINEGFNEFSGGSRVIADGGLAPGAVGRAAAVLYAAGTLLGLALARQVGSPALAAFILLGTFAGYAYTGTPFRLGYRGMGELVNAAVFGPLVVLIAYYAQVPAFSPVALAASLLPGALLAILLLINEFPDHDADAASRKRTLVVRIGKPGALLAYHASLAAVYVATLAMLLAGLLPPPVLLTLFTLPLAAGAVRASRTGLRDPGRMVVANIRTYQLHAAFGLLLCAGFLLPAMG